MYEYVRSVCSSILTNTNKKKPSLSLFQSLFLASGEGPTGRGEKRGEMVLTGCTEAGPFIREEE